MSYIAYVVLATLISLLLARRHDRRVLSFLIFFWILAQPIMTWKFPLTIPGLPFQLHLNRILFLTLMLFLLPGMLTPSRSLPGSAGQPREKRPAFMIWLFFLFASTVISLMYNIEQVPAKEILTVITDIILFALFYAYSRRAGDNRYRQGVLLSILCTAVLAVGISVVQLTILPDFLRIADPRAAYGKLARTTGIFYNEYELGYFMILSLFISLTCLKNRIAKLAMAAMCAFCVLITFHRLSYIILVLTSILYLKLFKKFGKLSLLMVGGLILMLTAMVVSSLDPDILSRLGKTSMKQNQVTFEDRFMNDTVTGRFRQYGIALEYAFDNPLGIGTYDAPDYFRLMSQNKMLGGSYLGGYYALAVHNGFLSIAVLYGLMSMFFFIAFCISALRYAAKRFRMEDPPSLVPFFGILIFILGNLSNPFSEFRTYFLLLVALLIGAFHRKGEEQKNTSLAQKGLS